ncbi:MAG: guanylate kinase [Bacteroidales bacterium]|nr:guanylate kinase [Bacteroidales bacterium]
MNDIKLIIISAPSGSGKSTIIGRIIDDEVLKLQFSISATTRAPRGAEQHGKEYYFLSEDDFKARIARDEFAEYEEVYPGRFYGTLKSEIQRINDEGKNAIIDVDVAGGVNVKKIYGEQALSIFVMPPSVAELRRRLEGRATDSAEDIQKRVDKAEFEMSFAPKFDKVIINDDLEKAVAEARAVITEFVTK